MPATAGQNPRMSARRFHLQRLFSDRDVLHALLVTGVVTVASGGLVYLAWLWQSVRVASRAGTTAGGAVLVFGKHCIDGRPDAEFRARLQRAHALANTGQASRVLLLGGGGDPTEAAVAARELRALGWPEQVPLLLEDQSRDTLENLRHAHALMGVGDGPALLLSNRYHLARCALLADCIGLEHRLCAAEDGWRFTPKVLLEAGLSLCIDVGRRWARLIGHRRMLDKLSVGGAP